MKFGVYVCPIYPGEMDGTRGFDLALAMAEVASVDGDRRTVAA